MLNIQRALENDRLLRALTGLNRQAFDELCEVFGRVYQETLQSDFKPRKRARGGGGKRGWGVWSLNCSSSCSISSVTQRLMF